MNDRSGFFSRNKYLVIMLLIGSGVLISGGLVYRDAASRLGIITETAVELPVSLNNFPYKIEGWEGKDIELTEAVQRAASNDDYINRTYKNKSGSERVNVYVAFTARPRTMLGHKPTVCYPASGWVHDWTNNTNIVLRSGRNIPCMFHRFHKPAPESSALIVLNFYIVNGEYTIDESIFSSVFWRTPNIQGNPARYVAQIQISSSFEGAVRKALLDMAELLIPYMPNTGDKTEVSSGNTQERLAKNKTK